MPSELGCEVAHPRMRTGAVTNFLDSHGQTELLDGGDEDVLEPAAGRPWCTACFRCGLLRSPPIGEVSERVKEHAWKVCIGNPYRGFESLPLRQFPSTRIPSLPNPPLRDL